MRALVGVVLGGLGLSKAAASPAHLPQTFQLRNF